MKTVKRLLLTIALALAFLVATPKPAAAQNVACVMGGGTIYCGNKGPVNGTCYIIMLPCQFNPPTQGPDDTAVWIGSYFGYLYNFFWVM